MNARGLAHANDYVSRIIDGRVREHVVSARRPEPQGRRRVCHQRRHVGWRGAHDGQPAPLDDDLPDGPRRRRALDERFRSLSRGLRRPVPARHQSPELGLPAVPDGVLPHGPGPDPRDIQRQGRRSRTAHRDAGIGAPAALASAVAIRSYSLRGVKVYIHIVSPVHSGTLSLGRRSRT